MAEALINGQKIHYELAGVLDFKLRTPALLLHGNGESMRIWAKTVQPLLNSRGFVLMDSRFQGESKPVDPEEAPKITYDLMADDALKLMEAELNVPEYDIIGFSDGAIIALLMAGRSIRIRRLILIGVNSEPSGLKPKMIRIIRKELEDAVHRKSRLEAELLRLMLKEPHIKPNELAKIMCETTVVYGQKDEAIRREHTEAIADAMPRGSFVEIPNAGHDVPVTHPFELSELIRSLL